MSSDVRCLSRLENLRCSGLTLPQMMSVNIIAVVELGAIAYLMITRAKGIPLTWSAYVLIAEILITMILMTVYFGIMFVAPKTSVGLLETGDEVITFLSALPLALLILIGLLPSLSDIDTLPWADGTVQQMMTKAMAYVHVGIATVTGLGGMATGVLGGFLGVVYDTDVASVSLDGIATIGSSYANVDEWLTRSASISSCVAVAASVIPLIPRHLFSSLSLQTYLDRYSSNNTGDLRPLLDLIALILGLLVAAGELLMGVLQETFAILLVRRSLRSVARVLMAIGLAAVSRKEVPPGPCGHEHDSWAVIEGPEVAAAAAQSDAKSSVQSWVTGRRGRNRSDATNESIGIRSAAEMTTDVKHSNVAPSLKLNSRAVEPLNIQPPPMAQFEHPALTAPRPGYHYQVRRFSGEAPLESQHNHGRIEPPSPRVRPDLAIIQRSGGMSTKPTLHQRLSSFGSSLKRGRASDASQYSQQSLGMSSQFQASSYSVPRTRGINSILNSIYEGIEYKAAGAESSFTPNDDRMSGQQQLLSKERQRGPEEDGRRKRLLENIAHMQADPYDDEGEEIILGDRRDSPTIKPARRPRESVATSTWSSSTYTADPRSFDDNRGRDKPTYRDERVLSQMNRIPKA